MFLPSDTPSHKPSIWHPPRCFAHAIATEPRRRPPADAGLASLGDAKRPRSSLLGTEGRGVQRLPPHGPVSPPPTRKPTFSCETSHPAPVFPRSITHAASSQEAGELNQLHLQKSKLRQQTLALQIIFKVFFKNCPSLLVPDRNLKPPFKKPR